MSLRNATKDDYKKLLLACIEALLKKQIDVLMTTHHTTTFPKGFPKGVIVPELTVHPTVTRRAKVRKLLAWMYEHGHSTVSLEMLRVEGRKLTLLAKEILDNGFVLEDN